MPVVDLYVPAECSFRANRKNVANGQHPSDELPLDQIDRQGP
jgi:hypothetical protein